jgi:hypothetical protein
VGKARGIVKAERRNPSGGLRQKSGAEGSRRAFCNTTTRDCIFSLDTTSAAAQNPGNFFRNFRSRGPERCSALGKTQANKAQQAGDPHRRRKNHARFQRENTECSICRDGPCSASIRSAPLAATGCGRRTLEGNSAAIASHRFTTFHRRSAHACGCARARWAATVRRAARRVGLGKPDARRDWGIRASDPQGCSSRFPPGRAVPAASVLRFLFRNALRSQCPLW